MVKNVGSKNKRGRLMKNMKSPNSGLIILYNVSLRILLFNGVASFLGNESLSYDICLKGNINNMKILII